MTATPRIRVLCVDDHRIVREGIALIIAQQPDMKVVGFAATGSRGLDASFVGQVLQDLPRSDDHGRDAL